MNRALVSFQFSSDNYRIYCSNAGDVRNVAKALEKSRVKFSKDAGLVALDFAMEHRATHGGFSKIANSSLSLYTVDLTYDVNVLNETIVVREVSLGRVGKVLYTGKLDAFYEWSDASRQLRDAIDKVVRFNYRSSRGTSERLVKLTAVEGTGQATLLKGWDVNKTTSDKVAWRNFRIGNIIGNVEVVG